MERPDRATPRAALGHTGNGGVMLAGLAAFTLTPMDADGVVDTDHLGRLVARLAASGMDSIGVLGSTGSYMYLSATQRARAVAAAVEAAGSVPVLAGIGALRSSDVMIHLRAAERAGASAALLAPVSYLPLSEADVTALVDSVAAASSIPICLYNNPATTHFTMTEALVTALAAHPQVGAVKNPAPATLAAAKAQIAHLRAQTRDDFVLGYSGDALINTPPKAGADAWYSVIAGALPQLAQDIWAARGDAQRLDTLHAEHAALWALFKAHGGIRVVPHILDLLKLGPAPLPLPVQPLSTDIVAQLDAALDRMKDPA
ncbi:dihydrodipicolinate synthase family protein [Roseibaca sp. V10]|uniref:Dihydrodipicolinate synthase family protein n=1 Tax=Roseinatronobacter domitianus TaxID=2940293 RepID=A0ABT0M2B4_9RHOB|nr:dihydrodipicolinate synthase family protein [Roseibaca domitiana]MCL1629001.1 dihydrodipicolinate synthase family protein [Roseibaca domitiana]